MNILITGGLGFIGSNLCKLFFNKNYNIICIDHLGSSDKENLKLIKDFNINLIKKDINEPLEINQEIDQIYHTASRASPQDYQKHSVETALTGAIGTNNMIKLALKKKSRLFFTSSSEVYGNPKIHPQPESYHGNVNPIGPRSCYDESKRFSEALIMAYVKEKKLDARMCRIFNSYGPKMKIDDGRVMSNFINQALRNEPITVYGDGKQTRSFCYVEDTINGIYKLMNHEHLVGPVNIGNPEEISMIELANLIKKITNSNSEIIFKGLPIDDPVRRIPDITLAKEKLNWQPKISLKEGLKRTIDYYKEYSGL